MLQIDQTLISDELLEKKFVCDLAKCKGACCIDGDSGAPLLEEELDILDEIYDEVKPYLRPEGVEAIEKEGLYTLDTDGEYVTTLVKGKECAYVVFGEDGKTLCGIEKASREGKIDWLKPMSCHLYPVRVTQLKDFIAVNYHSWEICADACVLGEQLGVEVFRFLKEPLIRQFGEEWFEKLEIAYQALKQSK